MNQYDANDNGIFDVPTGSNELLDPCPETPVPAYGTCPDREVNEQGGSGELLAVPPTVLGWHDGPPVDHVVHVYHVGGGNYA